MACPEAIPAHLDAWGTHPGWSRTAGQPALYRQIETRLTDLLGAGDALGRLLGRYPKAPGWSAWTASTR